MINYLTKLALIDCLKIIKNNSDYFAKSTNEKKSKYVQAYVGFFPNEAIEFFSSASEKEIIVEINNVLKNLESNLSEIVIKFIALELSYKIDDYFQDPKNKIKQTSQFGKQIISLLESSTYNEICEKFSREIYKKTDGDIVIVESPLPLDIKLKAKIRSKYQKEDKICFVVFKINENILGGIKTYIDGKIIDDSWAQKIEKLEYISA